MIAPRTIIVGDVHGCVAELTALLATICPRADDRLVFVGDLIDKGPASVATVQLVRILRETQDVTLVMGNHEEKAARWRHHQARAVPNPMRDADGRYALLDKALSPRDVAFLDSAVLYHPVTGGLVVHAGVTPDMVALPPVGTKLGDLRGKEKRHFGRMLRVRHVRGGNMVPLGAETPDDPFWADVYDGRFGHIWFGHAATLEPAPRQFPYATGIDLGCVYGGRLGAAILGRPRVEYASVRARAAHAPRRTSSEETE